MDKGYRFIAAAIFGLLGIIVVLNSHIVALINIRDLSFLQAFNQAIKTFIQSPEGSYASILPYGFLGYFVSSKKKRDFLYIIPLLLIIPYYFYRYNLAEIYMVKKMWTASALSTGMAPIHSAMLIFVCFGIKHIILEIIDMRKDKNKEKQL